MTSERCPKCGSEMVRRSEELPWYCPRAPEYCRIAELERQLEEAKRWGDKLSKEVARLCSELNKSDQAVEEAWHEVAKEKSRADDHAGTIINLNGKLDAALDQVRETAEAVVALREALLANVDQPETPESYDKMMAKATYALEHTSATAQQFIDRIKREAVEEAVKRYDEARERELQGKLDAALAQVVVLHAELDCHSDNPYCHLDSMELHNLLSNTSATASQRVEAIRREAVEKAWERYRAAFEKGLPLQGSASDIIRAAILGEKSQRSEEESG